MTPASVRRYVVSARDYDLWQIVVEAQSRDEGFREAESIYFADGLGGFDCHPAIAREVTWHATPLVGEVRP